MCDKALSAAEIDSVVDLALVQQADLRRPWSSKWGDFVEEAYILGGVPMGKWKRYVRQSLADSLKLEVRPRVRRGDLVPARIAYRPLRVGSNGEMAGCIRAVLMLQAGDPSVPAGRFVKASIDQTGECSCWFATPTSDWGATQEGRHVAAAVVTIDSARPSGSQGEAAQETVQLKREWLLLPPDASATSLRAEPSLGRVSNVPPPIASFSSEAR
jgi:hypothetical protein